METKKIKFNGKEKKIVINITENEIENNDDIIENNHNLNDTIELTNIIETISNENKNE